jgi:DNA-binding protein H-NS
MTVIEPGAVATELTDVIHQRANAFEAIARCVNRRSTWALMRQAAGATAGAMAASGAAANACRSTRPVSTVTSTAPAEPKTW